MDELQHGAPAYELISENPDSTVVAEYTPLPRTETAVQTEAELEADLIKRLVAQGYERATFTGEAELIDNLRKQLERLNQITFTDREWKIFFDTQVAGSNQSIADKTRILQDGDTQLLLTREDGTTKNVRLLDKQQIHNNSVQVINQYEAEGGVHKNRYDVTILVNGLPLVHIELKKRGKPLKEAFDQIRRYGRESFFAGSGLFEYVQLFVISNGTQTKYYANSIRRDQVFGYGRKDTRTFEFTMWWADAKNNPIRDLADFARTFLTKRTLLNVLTKFCVFNASDDLMVMRPYQIVATERILARIRQSSLRKTVGTVEAGGYVWHTTGSGKTLTSFKTAQLATRSGIFGDKSLDLDKVLFVVDRQDLDYKTIKDFNKFHPDSVSGSHNTEALAKTLSDPQSRIVVTTIQKLHHFIKRHPKHPVYGQHVAVIFDECHRSQFGDMHRAIIRHFKNYHLFGFTGTPIFVENKASTADVKRQTTESIFGQRLHAYTIVDAVRDKTVLPFKVFYKSTLRTKEGISDEEVHAINTQEALLEPRRIRAVAEDIWATYSKHTLRKSLSNADGKPIKNGFNSIFCVDSIEAAIAYYNAFKQIDHDLRIGLIYSFAPNPEEPDGILAEEGMGTDQLSGDAKTALDQAIADYNRMFTTNFSTDGSSFQNYYKDISNRLQTRDLDMLIVVNMFLTGFDAPTLNTLWVDKNLRYHGLIQAFSRTNRIYDSVKTFGQVVCYRDLEEATNKAIALFGNQDASSTVLLKTYGEYKEMYDRVAAELQDICAPGQEPVPDSDEESAFVAKFGEVLRLRNILRCFDEFEADFQPINDRDLQDYQSVYVDIYRRLRDRNEVRKAPINDDLVFEVELIKSVEITLSYVLQLIRQYHDGGCRDGEVKVNIRKSIDASISLHSKRDLILDFVDSLTPSNDDIAEAWRAYVDERRRADEDSLIARYGLDRGKAPALLGSILETGEVPESGTAIVSVLPPTNMFSPAGERASLKGRVIVALREFLERYRGI